jgi:hypothetical protein
MEEIGRAKQLRDRPLLCNIALYSESLPISPFSPYPLFYTLHENGSAPLLMNSNESQSLRKNNAESSEILPFL